MDAAIVSVGNEVVRGRIADTNAAWLSRELVAEGFTLRCHLCVGDELGDIVRALSTALQWARLVIVTGGLGPTQDDLTRYALADLSGQPLVEHAPSLQQIRARFESMGKSVPESNRIQAMVPEGAHVLANAWGTAPGIWLELERSGQLNHVIALPGVPSEMKQMFRSLVLPELRRRLPTGRVLVERRLHVFGQGESHVESQLRDLTRRGQDPEVGVTVHEATITIRVVTSGRTVQEARNRTEPVVRTIYERLGTAVYGEEDEELEDIVARELQRLGLTLAVCEGMTGGAIQRRLARIGGASRWFRGGMMPYANDSKQHLLAVPAELIEERGAASAQVARHLAGAVRRVFKADLGLAAVGLMEETTAADLRSTVWIAVASATRTTVQRYRTRAGRREAQERAAKAALDHLRLRLLKARRE